MYVLGVCEVSENFNKKHVKKLAEQVAKEKGWRKCKYRYKLEGNYGIQCSAPTKLTPISGTPNQSQAFLGAFSQHKEKINF